MPKYAHELTDTVLDQLSEAIATGLIKDTDNAVQINRQNVKYAKDPVGWCELVFKEFYPEDIKEVMRSFAENRKTIVQSANAVGKTFIAPRLAVWFLLCSDQKTQVFTAAAPPEDNLKRLFWGEMAGLIQKFPKVFDGCHVSISSMKIVKKNDPESYIVGVTIPMTGSDKEREGRFSGKHAPRIAFIFDEGDAIPSEVYKGTESCISGGFARLLINFNPRFRGGAPYAMIKNKEANVVKVGAFTHPNVVEGRDVIPGAVTRQETASRILRWTRAALPDEKINPEHLGMYFFVPDYMDGYRCVVQEFGTGENRHVVYGEPLCGDQIRVVTDPAFSYMVLAEYPSKSANQLISEVDIEGAIQRHKDFVKSGRIQELRGRIIAGADIADLGEDSCVLTCRQSFFVHPQDIWKTLEVSESSDRIFSILSGYGLNRIEKINVDANGVGAAVPGLLNKFGLNAKRIMVQTLSSHEIESGAVDRVRDEMIWRMGQWFKTSNAMIPDDEELKEELLAITYYTDKKSRKIKIADTEVLKKILRRSPDKMMSLAFTFAPEPDSEEEAGEMFVSNYAFNVGKPRRSFDEIYGNTY